MATDAATGLGLPELLGTVTAATVAAYEQGGLREWRQSSEELAASRVFMGRARLVGHLGEHFGETLEEYWPSRPVEGHPGFIVVEHGPSSTHPYWTYATAGLSLAAQPAGGPEPPAPPPYVPAPPMVYSAKHC